MLDRRRIRLISISFRHPLINGAMLLLASYSGSVPAFGQAQPVGTWEPIHENRRSRGCGGNDAAWDGDPPAAKARDADVNGGGVTDRYAGSVVYRQGETVVKTIEIWCVDQAYWAVRMPAKVNGADRQWMV